jgi:hypothetical protein
MVTSSSGGVSADSGDIARSDGEPSGTLLRQRHLSLTAIKDYSLISSSKDLVRAIDITTRLTAMTRNVWSLLSCPLIETYSPGKKACVPNL